MHDKADGETEITNHSRVCNAFNPGLMEQPPITPTTPWFTWRPLHRSLPGAPQYSLVYLEPSTTPWFTRSPPLPPGLPRALHYPLVYLEPPQYSHVYLEPPLSHGLPGAPTIPWSTWNPPILPGLPGAPTIPWSTWSPHFSLVYLEPL